MSIQVTQDISEKQFPITVVVNDYRSLYTIKAAIELQQKLDTAISDYQIAEALANPAIRGAGIPRTGHHDAGAYARCSYCGRYSDKQSNEGTIRVVNKETGVEVYSA